MKKHIPNLVTSLNLVSGACAIYMVLQDSYTMALVFVALALVFDFLDGLTARFLDSYSELGKQLDSLSDLVSFGLVSAAMIFMGFMHLLNIEGQTLLDQLVWYNKLLLSSVLIVPVLSAIRLAKFNLQETEGVFYGLPVPAFAIFWIGIYYDIMTSGTFFNKDLPVWFYLVIMFITAFFMVLPLRMLTLKFKNFRLKENLARYLVILISVIIILFTGIPGLSLAILVYILFSLFTIFLT